MLTCADCKRQSRASIVDGITVIATLNVSSNAHVYCECGGVMWADRAEAERRGGAAAKTVKPGALDGTSPLFLCICGDGAVGKTTILHRYMQVFTLEGRGHFPACRTTSLGACCGLRVACVLPAGPLMIWSGLQEVGLTAIAALAQDDFSEGYEPTIFEDYR